MTRPPVKRTAPRRPGKRVLRGLTAISSEMDAVADCKASEDADGRREADDIRAALDWIYLASHDIKQPEKNK